MENLTGLINNISKNILPFIMVFSRLSAIFLVVPFFKSNRIPTVIKISSALALAIVIFPVVGIEINIMKLNLFENTKFYYGAVEKVLCVHRDTLCVPLW